MFPNSCFCRGPGWLQGVEWLPPFTILWNHEIIMVLLNQKTFWAILKWQQPVYIISTKEQYTTKSKLNTNILKILTINTCPFRTINVFAKTLLLITHVNLLICYLLWSWTYLPIVDHKVCDAWLLFHCFLLER